MQKNQITEEINSLRALSLQPHALVDEWATSIADFVAGNTWCDMVEKDLNEERIAIQRYKEMLASLGDKDPAMRQVLTEILICAERKAKEFVELLTLPGG